MPLQTPIDYFFFGVILTIIVCVWIRSRHGNLGKFNINEADRLVDSVINLGEMDRARELHESAKTLVNRKRKIISLEIRSKQDEEAYIYDAFIVSIMSALSRGKYIRIDKLLDYAKYYYESYHDERHYRLIKAYYDLVSSNQSLYMHNYHCEGLEHCYDLCKFTYDFLKHFDYYHL